MDHFQESQVYKDELYTLTVSPPLPTVVDVSDNLDKVQRELWDKREERNLLVEPQANTPEHSQWKCKMQNLNVEIKKLEQEFSLEVGENVSSEALTSTSSLQLERFSGSFFERKQGYSLGPLLSCTSSATFTNTGPSQEDLDAEAREDIRIPKHITDQNNRCCGYLIGKPLGSGAFSSVRKGYFGCTFKSSEAVRLVVAKLIALEFSKDVDFVNHLTAEFDSNFVLNEIIYGFMKGDKGPGSEKVALKFTEKPRAGSKSRFTHDQQFKTELSVFKHVRSPNIVRCYALNPSFSFTDEDGQRKEHYAMCLELCEHGNLFDLVYYNKPLGEKLARTLFLQVCRGVSALHAKDFVHRDIKPQNIVLDSEFTLKLCDFGSSWRMRNHSMKQYSLGTRGFRAPEIVLKHPYSKKCDAFSCGVLLFVLLTKLMPEIEEATPKDKLYRFIASRNLPRFWRLLESKVSGLSVEVKSLLGKLLTYQPNERLGINERTSSTSGITYPGVFSHPWCKGPVYTQEELKPMMRELYENSSKVKKEKAAKEKNRQEQEKKRKKEH